MSIESLAEVFERLRALPDDQQRLACDFIQFLEGWSGAKINTSSTRPKKPSRRRSRSPKSALVLKNGLWVHTGKAVGKFDKSFYRGVQAERFLRHLKSDGKAQS